MDGRGRFSDNIFVERLWRNLKYEKIYLSAYQNAAEARYSIAADFDFYNCERLHQGLDCCAPRLVFDEALGIANPGQEEKGLVQTTSYRHNNAHQTRGGSE